MPKNSLSEMLNKSYCNGLDEGMTTGMQFALDLAVVSLHDKYGFGAKRICEFITEFQKNYTAYKGAFKVKNDDCDVLQEKLDKKLREAFSGSESLSESKVTDGLRYRAVEFKKRYPNIKEIKY